MSLCRSYWQCQSCWLMAGLMFCLPLSDVDNVDDNHVTSRSLSISLARWLPACPTAWLFPYALSSSLSALPYPALPLAYFSHSCTCLYLLVLGLAGRPRLPFVCCFIFIIFISPASHILCLSPHKYIYIYTRTHTYLHTCQQKSFTLHCFTQFAWFLLAAYFLRVFLLIFLFPFPVWFSPFEFTANLLQIVYAKFARHLCHALPQ